MLQICTQKHVQKSRAYYEVVKGHGGTAPRIGLTMALHGNRWSVLRPGRFISEETGLPYAYAERVP